jgi:hypothetical protein
LAFKKYGDGISVIQEDCVSKTSTICNHLRKYYSSVDTPPHIFWVFNRDIIPKDCDFIQRDSDTGDKCHYDIVNLSAKKAKKIFNKYNYNGLKNFQICDNNHPRQLEQADLSKLTL